LLFDYIHLIFLIAKLNVTEIRSRVEYLKPTDNMHTENDFESLALFAGYQYDLMTVQKWLTFIGPPCRWGIGE